jgi:hypothetical protein
MLPRAPTLLELRHEDMNELNVQMNIDKNQSIQTSTSANTTMMAHSNTNINSNAHPQMTNLFASPADRRSIESRIGYRSTTTTNPSS